MDLELTLKRREEREMDQPVTLGNYSKKRIHTTHHAWKMNMSDRTPVAYNLDASPRFVGYNVDISLKLARDMHLRTPMSVYGIVWNWNEYN